MSGWEKRSPKFVDDLHIVMKGLEHLITLRLKDLETKANKAKQMEILRQRTFK